MERKNESNPALRVFVLHSVEKIDLGGLDTTSIRWIATDSNFRMDVSALRRQIEDTAAGDVPFLVVGTAGSVSTGAVGCALVRDPEMLRAAFAYHPPYYHFEERVTNFID